MADNKDNAVPQICPVCTVEDCMCRNEQDDDVNEENQENKENEANDGNEENKENKENDGNEGDESEDDDLCYRCAVPWEDCDCGDYDDQEGRHCGICHQLMYCNCTQPRQCDVCQQPKRYCSCNNTDASDSD